MAARPAAWHTQRVMVTAELLGIPPGEAQLIDIRFCRVWRGRPGRLEVEPKIRLDRRYGARQSHGD